MTRERDPKAGPRVAIIGAGISGIAMGVKLLEAGLDNFRMFEAADEIGGTWRQNTYPGAAVDVHSTLYQFSFNNNHWKRTHGRQQELLAYLKDTVERFGLLPHLSLNTQITEVRWDEDTHEHALTFHDGTSERFDVVVSALGFLDDINHPTWPGIEDFGGELFHTAQWRHDLDLTGKRVAVVGVGSTAVQIIPAIQPIVDQLYVFQREPGWIMRKGERTFTDEEMEKYSSVLRRKIERWKLVARIEWMYVSGPVYNEGSRRNKQAEAASRAFIDASFPDRPDLREAVTPKYIFSGKRRVLSDDYYPTLLKENVTLVPRAVASVSKNGIVDVEGNEYPVDVIVTATGFRAAEYLSKLKVYGIGGQEIQELWADGAFALAGMSVQNFPNFYMLYGPGTNGSGTFSVNAIAESQSGWIIKDLKRMRRRGITAIDTKASVVERYNVWLQKRLQRTAWVKANNYMKGRNGKLVTQFAGGTILYSTLLVVLRPIGTTTRRLKRGHRKVSG